MHLKESEGQLQFVPIMLYKDAVESDSVVCAIICIALNVIIDDACHVAYTI